MLDGRRRQVTIAVAISAAADAALGWRVVASGAVTAAVLLGGCCDDRPREGGPLAPSASDGITGSGIPVAPHQIFNDRHALLINTSERDAELVSVHRLGMTGELRDGRTFVALGTAARGPVTGAGRGFPPRNYTRKDLKSPRGFRVPPSRSRSGRFGAVIMTFGRVRAGHSFGMRGYEVVYRVADTEYRTVVPQAVAVCAALARKCSPDALLRRMLSAASAAREE